MPKTLDQAIAKLLAASNVGMFRKEIFDAIDKKLTDSNIEKVSAMLNKMQVSGNVDKGVFVSGNGCRWKITAKGRMYYSELHDDKHGISVASTTDSTDTDANTARQPMKTVYFDTDDELDRGLYGIVELIRSVANQPTISIERKGEKIALLEKLENNDLFPTNMRDLLGYIRHDIEQLDGARA